MNDSQLNLIIDKVKLIFKYDALSDKINNPSTNIEVTYYYDMNAEEKYKLKYIKFVNQDLYLTVTTRSIMTIDPTTGERQTKIMYDGWDNFLVM